MTVKRAAFTAILFAWCAHVPASNSATLELTPSVVHVITSEEGESRVLMGFSGVRVVQEEWVSRASLEIGLPGATPTDGFAVEVDLLGTAWDGTATWTSPWRVPGGDLEGREDGESALRGGRTATHLSLDVTNQIRAIVDGEVASNGMVLMPANARDEGFSADELEILGTLGDATLVIHYRRLTGLGVQGGARAYMERVMARRKGS